MKQRVTAALAVLMTVPLLTSCGNPQAFSENETLSAKVARTQDAAITYNYADGAQDAPAAYLSYANSSADFSLRQLRNRAENATESFVFSPAAATLQTALLANAASKDTRQEILQALGGGTLTADDLNACSSYFQSRMETVSRDATAHVAFDGAVLIDDSVDVRTSFLQANADFFGYDVFRYGFSGEYAAQKLANYLQPYTDDSGISPAKTLNLVSACTLSDTWLEASSKTAQGVFHGKKGETTLPFFTSTAKLLHSGKATGVLKYTKNNPLKLLLVLPDAATDFDSYLSGFDTTELNALLDSMDVTQAATAALPVFTVKNNQKEVSCANVLTKSGLFSLFGGKAGFSALSYTENAAIGDLYEIPADFTLNQNGVNTSQSASTADISADKAFAVDRPFLFFLLDNETDIPVLAGCYF